MIMPGRQFSAGSGYRYGFNGKENDNEVKGEGNQQDYGMRIYDPRLGKFLSVDPLTKDYPWNSPYVFSENDVIRSTDMDGMERVITFFNPFTMQPVVICIGCGIREASDNYIGGLTQKTKVEDGQMSYQNDKVPQSVQEKIDNVKTIDANAKIIKGVAQTTKISVETSAEISSNIIPLSQIAIKGRTAINIALGLRNKTQLASFAKSVNALPVEDWLKNGLYKATTESFEDAFKQATDKVIKSGGKIKFDLTGFDLKKALKAKGKSLYDEGVGYTDWEFNQIIGDKKLLSSTEFYEYGKKISSSEILKRVSTK